MQYIAIHYLTADQAIAGCSRVSASNLESYRNILLTQCSTVTPLAATNGMSLQ